MSGCGHPGKEAKLCSEQNKGGIRAKLFLILTICDLHLLHDLFLKYKSKMQIFQAHDST